MGPAPLKRVGELGDRISGQVDRRRGREVRLWVKGMMTQRRAFLEARAALHQETRVEPALAELQA